MTTFERHLFICSNHRDPTAARPSCDGSGARLKDEFKNALRVAGLGRRVRANAAGCLDQCEHGPVVVVYPEAVWYGFVKTGDVAEIVDSHLIRGIPVERLRLQDSCLNVEQCPHRAAPPPRPKEKD